MNKSLILLCFLPFSINFSKSCDYSNNNVNDDGPKYVILNDFSIKTHQSTLGSFHSGTFSTGLKVLISDFDLKNTVSKYRYFSIDDEVLIFYYSDTSIHPQYLVYLFDDSFVTSHYLVDGQTRTKDFYVEGWNGAGYYQAYVEYNFTLDLSTSSLYFSVVVHVYGGWCFSVMEIDAQANFDSGCCVYFYNNI